MTKGEESRQRLIKCAAELFWKNGYSATGISQILQQTGLPKGSFYFYFKSKDELAIAVAAYYQGLLLEHFQNIAQGKKWENFVEDVFDFLSARTTGRNFAGCPYAVMGTETALSRPDIASAFMDGVTCSHHLNLTDFEVGPPARLPFRAKLKQAIPACPAVLFYLVTHFSLCRYAHFLYIFFPSFRILTAAFTSRSIRFPHSHM